MKLTARERILIVILLIVALFSLYYQFILTRQLAVIDELRQDVVNLKAEVTSYNTINLDNIKSSLTSINQKIEISNQELPDYANIEEFIVSLDDIISSTGVNFEEINFNSNQGQEQSVNNQQAKSSNNKNNYTEIPVNIKVTGDYASITAFIRDIQTLKRINDIKSLEITSDNGSNGLLLDMDIVIYSMNKKGGSYLEAPSMKGKSDPFKPLIEENQNPQSSNTNPSGQNSVQGIDINKIITDSINNALNSASKIAPTVTSPKQQ
ncbi:type 4a pilus biogenesis protein PilO [Thermoanaerobacterium thermosaccharolyticum]|uniref:type 4a pilus biogenesis protein PilO n=1 Tax=Thermoanaerobacterium thermosaccharolyticum TaxID=1517 RepID=UPI00178476BB|nr:type 4a pilus biogenesis protein PilO [Thermoanaerobacterium thermosaccharolyticum]MBE0067731.1 type 4a pilus biogenesis protein PilO [Thermoanaerobacterium thermosaccharolyticum]MBE0227297.1 type 4a pilus biogenesis protein PilO [Thermoanaerobacterium thermosaccharolyticum]